MDYQDLEDAYEFHRNMRRTPWEKLFPHWFDTSDTLLKAIGDEVERIKATSVFALLNAGIKPPVLLWQESIEHKEYHANFNINKKQHQIKIQAPLYKTWGQITLTNNTKKDIKGLKIELTEIHGIVINQLISQEDKIVIDVTNNKVFINNNLVHVEKIGNGIPYFVTRRNRTTYDETTPLHNEAIKIDFTILNDTIDEIDIDVDVQLDNVVFTNEQNIEITGLEAVPIERVELYAKYDFPYNSQYNGWHKVFEKKYDEDTNVIYDMITKQFYTKNFYVDVWFKTLQYPYKVGFPCYKDAEPDSMYHVNNRLDSWGNQLGLKRRTYKSKIDEKEYINTFPIYYPFDIEQDYWYYRRLTHEYAWNEQCIDSIDIKDTENMDVIRLYSVNPFIEDFVVHAKSHYPVDKEFVNYSNFTPITVQQKAKEGMGIQTEFSDIINLLSSNNDEHATLTLNNYSDNNDVIYKRPIDYNKSVKYIASATHQSTELMTYFDLSTLPSNINIDNIEVIVEGNSTDNKTNKYSTEDTGLVIPTYDGKEYFIPLTQNKDYQLKKQAITYSSNELIDYLNKLSITDENIIQRCTIGEFEGHIFEFMKIPFELEENGEIVDDITDVWVYYDDMVRSASYKEEDGKKYIYVYLPNVIATKMTIICKSETHKPFNTTIDIRRVNQYNETNTDVEYQYYEGPLLDGGKEELVESIEWHTNDIRNLIQRQGIYFRNIIKNIDQQSFTTVYLYNIKLKVTYSPKQSDFELETYIDSNDAEAPNLGKYIIKIINTGEKLLNTNIDIITPPNIQMEYNTISVIALKPGVDNALTKEINITPSYPISDGYYDIVTMCEDEVKINSIEVISDGLTQTGIKLNPHHGKYDDAITLIAEVYAVDGSIIDGNEIEFYINGYKVGNGQKAIVHDNKVEFTIYPGDYKFTGTGNLPLEAKLIGNTKYASSNKKSTIFISKDDTRMTMTVNETAPYKGSLELKAKVEYLNNGQYVPVDAGSVEFYINDETFLIITEPSINGNFIGTVDRIDNLPGNYTLSAKYYGTTKYSATETSQKLEIIGGDAKVAVYDITAKPQDTVKLRAKVTDINNKNIINGYVDFTITDYNGNEIDFGIENLDNIIKNVEVKNGIATSPSFQVQISNNITSETFIINARYHNTLSNESEEIYGVGEDSGYMHISKGNVEIKYDTTYGTQYEPLGFYVQVIDVDNKKPISEDLSDGETQYEDIPIDVGKIKISFDGHTIEKNVDENGIARLLYNPLYFTAKEWDELEKTQLQIDNDGVLWDYYNGEETRATVVFEYNSSSGELLWTGQKPQDEEVLYIASDGNLYARITEDSFRQYTIGYQNITIEYISNGQYNNTSIDVAKGLYIKDVMQNNIDLELQTYDLTCTSDDNIYCYVTQRNMEEKPTSTNMVGFGKIQFSIDNELIDTVDVPNTLEEKGIVQLQNNTFRTITYGEHLLKAEFLSVNDRHLGYISYALLNFTKDSPIMSIRVDREVPNKNTNVYVELTTPYNANTVLCGQVALYLNDTLIGSQYLHGNEGIMGIVDPDNIDIENDIIPDTVTSTVTFNVVMPDDINVQGRYKLKAIYRGNDYFDAISRTYAILAHPSNVQMNVKNEIYVAYQEQANLNIEILCSDDIINEGEVILEFGNQEIAKANIIDNKATLSWTVNNQPSNEEYDYNILYTNATAYYNNNKTIKIHVIEPLTEISIPDEQPTLEDALMCMSSDNTNNTIYITDDIILTRTINIEKDCTIIGNNGKSIIKDVSNLLSNYEDLPITDLTDTSMYEIPNLSLINLNTTDFALIDGQIYAKTPAEYTPIYLSEDGKFYSEKKLQLNQLLSNVNINIKENVNVNIDNVILKSNDSNSIADFVLYNEGNCTITHSIIESTTKLINQGTLTAQRNLIYGTCSGEADLDNNWWGTNTPPYPVNNHIIIQVNPVDTPAVITEEVDIVGEMIGANGQRYDLPSATFTFTAETGYFSTDTGLLTNNRIKTTYLDAEQEGNIFFTVDKETVSCPIYSYERKTEVIIEDIKEVLINYQIPITARVQSCADIYYEFDNENHISKSTELINEGYMSFFIDNKQVGYTKVNMGEAKILVFFKDPVYVNGRDYNLTVKYHSSENYFDSQSSTTVTVINEDDACFVSPLGSDDGDGTYGNPMATIKTAIDLNKNTIYLLNGEYNEYQIPITRDVTIKKYNGTVTFKNITGNVLFNIFNSKHLTIEGIDFIENSLNRIFYNGGEVDISECIFYKNKGILFEDKPDTTPVIRISLSAIVDNRLISETLDNNKNFAYCWFGTNTPPEDFNNYIWMDTELSKDKIYIGTLAHVTAKLDYYILRDNDNIYKYKLDDDTKLPLRIAKFATDIGSAKPVKDYTYSRRSTSLINTLEENNTQQIIITLENNIFYDKHNVDLVFHIKDVFDNYITKNNFFQLHIYNDIIDIKRNIKNTNGKIKHTLPPLSIDTYNVECSYIYNNIMYTYSGSFVVKPLQIIISNLNIGNKSNLYYMHIDADVTDNFNNNINGENIDIEIDDLYIRQVPVRNGKIDVLITYPLLKIGAHILKLNNTQSQVYDTLHYQTAFNVQSEKTYIVFNYDLFEADVSNDLVIEVNDSNEREVQTGYIRVDIDDTIQFENIPVSNGIAIIEDVVFTNNGQHSIVIYYTDNQNYYQDAIKVNNIGVGIYHVLMSIDSSDMITADIGKNFNLSLTVQDIGHQDIDTGFINIYIDDGIYLSDNKVTLGNVNITEPLPNHITSGNHKLTIEYIDYNGKYLNTYVYPSLMIGKIPTSINIGYISAPSGQQKQINYSIDSEYGTVGTGKLTAYYNDKIIGESIVTDSVVNQINLSIPLLSANNDYDIIFKYHDDSNNYEDDTYTSKLNIERSEVIITPQKTWYYPQKDFNFSIDIRDQENKIIDNGLVDLYIDNVKEHTDIPVVNGQAIISLYFNQARTYNIDIVYKEDEYYLQTHYQLPFAVDNLIIDDISFNDALESLPRQTFSSELIFETLDNYNVTDGIVDIFFDENHIKRYYVAENNKYIDFDIGDEIKGEYTLSLKYHDSSIFADFEKDYIFTVMSKNINMCINRDNNYNTQDIVANSSDTIDIVTSFGNIVDNNWTNCNIQGLVKYYIEIPIYRVNDNMENYIDDYYSKFIGVQEVDNESEISYQYTLSDDLLEYAIDNLETHYRIKAHFLGNNEYNECIEYTNLNIYKQDTHVTLYTDMSFPYQSEASIRIRILTNGDNTRINGTHTVDVYIDDEFINTHTFRNGDTQYNENHFKYPLHSKYIVGTHKLRVVFDGSAIYNGSERQVNFTITPFIPILNTNHINAYIGGDTVLDNIIYNANDVIIESGELIYTINDEEVICQPNVPHIIQLSNTENFTINVAYNSDDLNKYDNFTNQEISVSMLKNPIKLSLTAPESSYRDEAFDITLEAVAPTTHLPINLTFTRDGDTFEMIDGAVTTSLTHPFDVDYQPIVENTIETVGNDIFESASIQLLMHIQNQNLVTYDTTIPQSGTNAHTLEKAMDLVNDYGIIQINNSLNNKSITELSKNITIQASKDEQDNYNDIRLKNCTITNTNKQLKLKGLTFKDAEAGRTCVTNDGTLEISDCKFYSNHDTVIKANGVVSIMNSEFINNQASIGACINIGKINYKISITNCLFRNNNASLYGSCIYSNKVNNMEISNNTFRNNNDRGNNSSCIYTYGNVNISSNTFFNNIGSSQIQILAGNIGLENNLFDGKIKSISIQQNDTTIDADLNYWGYDNIADIRSHNENIDIDNYLIAHCEFYDKEDENHTTQHYVIGYINQYINRLETETTTINMLDKCFPIIIDNEEHNINKEHIISTNSVIKIGQQTFSVVNE